MSLHKPVFYLRKEKETHIFHNCGGALGFVSSEMVDDRTRYLIELAIEEGKRQRSREIAELLGVLK